MDFSQLYSQVIKDHSISKHNLHRLSHPTVVRPGKNPSCGDEIELELEIADGVIQDGAYTGVGCAISQASVSIMLDLVRGKTVQEADELCGLFLNMIRKEPLSETDEQKLEEALALQNISTMPARVKCATMPWHTLQDAIAALT